MKEVKTHWASYINDQTSQAQHQNQMYQCLMKSLSDTARLCIESESVK